MIMEQTITLTDLPQEVFDIIMSYITDLNEIYQLIRLFNKKLLYMLIHGIRHISGPYEVDISVLNIFLNLKRIDCLLLIKDSKELKIISEKHLTTLYANVKNVQNGEIVNFINENPQLVNFVINDKISLINGVLTPPEWSMYNESIINPHANKVCLVHIDSKYIDPDAKYTSIPGKTVPFKHYTLMMPYHHVIKEPCRGEWQDNILTIELTIYDTEIASPSNPQCFLRHKFIFNEPISLTKFNTLICGLKWKFPNGDLSKVVYNRTAYKELLIRKLNTMKIKLEKLEKNRWSDRRICLEYNKKIRKFLDKENELILSPFAVPGVILCRDHVCYYTGSQTVECTANAI